MVVNVTRNRLRGFSLIELIVGIVAFSSAMVIVITLVVNQTQQSIDPVLQTRAAALAQSLADEIAGKAYDENSNFSGSIVRCDEQGISCSSVLGPENGESRANYDDVDDYDNLFANSGGNIESALGLTATNGMSQLYQGFAIDVQVQLDNRFGVPAKRITITVSTSGNDVLDFTFFRMNY